MRLKRDVIVTLVLSLGLPGVVAAQPNETPHNLQVLPLEMSREEVVGVMRVFEAALGVGCEHCHFEAVAGEPDFAADNPTKEVARTMMRMMDHINDIILADDNRNAAYFAGTREVEYTATDDHAVDHALGEVKVQVECATCHRGQEHPRLLPNLLSTVHKEDGIDAAINHYHELRGRYYGSHTYDFSVQSLNEFAEQLMADNHVDDALTILEFNGGMFPESANVHMLMGQATLQRGDREAALRHVERALALEPENFRAGQLLSQLR